jgi:hypothetical protein
MNDYINSLPIDVWIPIALCAAVLAVISHFLIPTHTWWKFLKWHERLAVVFFNTTKFLLLIIIGFSLIRPFNIITEAREALLKHENKTQLVFIEPRYQECKTFEYKGHKITYVVDSSTVFIFK